MGSDGDVGFAAAAFAGAGDVGTWPDQTRQRLYEVLAEPRAGDSTGLVVDTDPKVCPTCHRELKPWRVTCPDDGSPATVVRPGTRPD